jgi:hypothetical protein
VANKNKHDALRDKVLFINADREYAEGKAQNKLRPEDIEKIDFVFTHKRELPKYSRLVDKAEIVETHDYNLNIRRYVDNTPEPEPENVQAHLIGGVPESEVQARQADFAKFNVESATLFQAERPGYLAFCPVIDAKPAIKAILDADLALNQNLAAHRDTLEAWWAVARDDFDVRDIIWAINLIRHKIDNLAIGSTVKGINVEQLLNFEIYNLTKPEQTKIAEILSTVDRAIEQTEALIAKQQRIKTGLMQDLLTRGIDERGNLRSEQTHQFKDSRLGRIPVEWEVGELESVSEFVTSGSRGWAQYYSADGAIFLRIGNLTRNHINLRFEDIVFVNPPRIS